MKLYFLLIITFTFTILIESKVKLNLEKMMTNKFLAKMKSKNAEPVTYITLMEGTRETYAICQSICRDRGLPTYYAEVTDFPNYGMIFRCQCGDNFTSWYNSEDLTELCLDILLGDTLFNDYFNMIGYDTSDCECNALKEMLGKMLQTN